MNFPRFEQARGMLVPRENVNLDIRKSFVSTYQEIMDQYKKAHSALRSESQPPEVIGWVSYDSVPSEGPERIGGWGGFVEHGDRWKDFIEAFDEEGAPYYEALRSTILRRRLKQGGDWHQNDAHGVPVFNDGTVGMFTFRAWGDLMAAVWAEHDNRDYSYMDFYMDSCIPDD